MCPNEPVDSLLTSCIVVWSVVETKPLRIAGHVGGSVDFTCRNWNVWTSYDYPKYLCKGPCSKDEDIIIRAGSGKFATTDRIRVHTTVNDLHVSMTKLSKSDSGRYTCGLERPAMEDSYIEVDLNVEAIVRVTSLF